MKYRAGFSILASTALFLTCCADRKAGAEPNALPPKSTAVGPGANQNDEGLRLFTAGSFAAALEKFRAAAAADPKEAEYPNNQGMCLMRLGKPAEARVLFQKAIDLRPKLALYHMNLGIALLELNDPGASGAFARATELEPRVLEGWKYLGVAYHRAGKIDLAVGAWDRAIALGTDSEVENNLGSTFMEKGDLARARRHLEKAVVQDPANSLAHFNLGVLNQKEGRNDLAARSYRLSIAADPQRFPAHFNLGIVLTRLGKKKEAIRSFEDFLRTCPPSLGPQIADARAKIAELRGGR